MPRNVDVAAGKRDKLVQIETSTDVTRPSGLAGQDWVPLGKPMYMSRSDMAADERFTESQQSAWGRSTWQMPYVVSMDPELVDVPKTKRLNFNGRIFNIEAALLMEQRLGITLVTLVSAARS